MVSVVGKNFEQLILATTNPATIAATILGGAGCGWIGDFGCEGTTSLTLNDDGMWQDNAGP